ncbi:MAG: adenylosuccinate synthase [Candidatus Sericytochromatia bacterium]|nr:adenylosuccinate synthase [Candidatus Sericytochromatia bacterium]
MATVVVVGAQWGDEGKGKVIDLLAARADMVVRAQGGNNAGHTVVADGRTYKLHLVPSGILYPAVDCVIGAGVVVDPAALLLELQELEASGVSLAKLQIARAAHVTMPYHRVLDLAEERRRGKAAIGTTGRGIGPTYTDKVNRSGIRLLDLLNAARFRARLADILPLKNAILTQVYGESPLDEAAIVQEYLAYGQRLSPFLCDVAPRVAEAADAGRAVLCEGAQGTMLDLDAGTYPFVTSSYPVAAGACLGTGLGPTSVDRVLGVAKAYTTRVGAGPFPTELHDADGDKLRREGAEFGTTTGRARRCGWLDTVVLRHAVRVNGLDSLAVTKLDVLDHFSTLKICVAYRLRGERLLEMPDSADDLAACEPEYEEWPGWNCPTAGVRRREDLPAAAQAYLARIETLVGRPIVMVGVGPEREATMVEECPLRGARRRLAAF